MRVVAPWQEYDRRVVVLTLLLLAFGSAMVHGATAYGQGAHDPASYGALPSHLQRVGIALVVCAIAAQIHYRRAAQLATLGVFVSIGLLGLVVFSQHAVGNAGIFRWLSVFGFVFQPVEVAKVSLVLALPAWIDRDPARLRRGPRELLVIVAPVLAVGVLLLLQPNFASALALGLICLVVLWVGGAPSRWIGGVLGLAGAAAWFGFTHIDKLAGRAEAWRRLLFHESFDMGMGYQPYQALMSLGNGGLFGARAGESLARYEFIPDSHTDFVFAVAGEQLGFFGVFLVLIGYAALLARILKIARGVRDGQAYLMAVSIAVMIGVYATLNLAMVCGLIPVMGLPLPFVSWGGSAMITNMAAIGVLLTISRGARAPRRASARWQEVSR